MTATCPYTPEKAGYAVQGRAAGAVIEIQLDGGLPARRLNKLGAVTRVTAQWELSLSKGDFAAFVTFWKTTLVYGTLQANFPLVLDGVLANYLGAFVAGTFQAPSAAQGDTYTVTADLWVQEI
jgi:hypothetical protein